MYRYLANVRKGDLDAELEEEHVEREGARAVDYDRHDNVELVAGREQQKREPDVEHHCYPTTKGVQTSDTSTCALCY